MSHFSMAVRVIGAIDQLERVAAAADGLPYKLSRQGDRRRAGRIQQFNVLVIELAAWDRGGIVVGDPQGSQWQQDQEALMVSSGTTLRRLAPTLTALDHTCCEAELYISTIREEAQGGFSLPAMLVSAAASAHLALALSILVMLDDEGEVDVVPT